MILRDNTTYYSTAENLEQYLSLQNVANRRISELMDDNGNDLLIYPHSFCQCEDEAGKQVLLSMQTSWKERQCTKVKMETGNMVGFIGVNGLFVSIHSRFTKDAGEDFFLHYMLHKVLGINIVNMLHGTADEPMFDFLLYLFPKLLNEALEQGIYKEYQRNEYNNANIRGTIDISRHLRKNVPFNGRIAYRTRELSRDNHITELIRHTIDYISKIRQRQVLLENDAETRTSVARIVAATPNYDRQKRETIIKSNSRSVNHPYYSRYAPLQKLCLQILRHERSKYGSKDNKIYGILFDVSYLWEEYLGTILTKQGFKHPNNRKGIGRIYLDKYNKLPRYPDFYREQDHAIADAKYKRSVDCDDVHQLVTYMYRLKGRHGIFIQPNDKICMDDVYNLLGYGTENGAKLQKFFFPIPQSVSDYRQFVDGMMVAENILRTRLRFYK